MSGNMEDPSQYDPDFWMGRKTPTLTLQYWKKRNEFIQWFYIIIIIMHLYSAQYLHILQDSKRYLTNPTVQVQPQLTSDWHSPNWKTEAQGWPFMNVLEVL